MKTDVMDKVFQYIDALAEKLGVASEFVFVALVKQQVIEGWVYTIVPLLSLVVFTVIFILLVIKVNNLNNVGDFDIDEPMGIILTLTLVLSGISMIVGIITSVTIVPESVMKIANPEYYAIKEIMDLFQ